MGNYCCVASLRWPLQSGRFARRHQPLELDVAALGFAENAFGSDAAKNKFIRLATALEELDEARAAEDRRILCRMVARYEEEHGKVGSSVSVTAASNGDLAESAETSPDGCTYKSLRLTTHDTCPILDGTVAQEMIHHVQQFPDEPLHPHCLTTLLELTKQFHKRRDEQHGPVFKLGTPGRPQTASQGNTPPSVRWAKHWKHAHSRIVILGDTHGQLGDLLSAFAEYGLPSERNVYMVNGDIADRGAMSTEIFALLFTLMLQHPSEPAVVINRGNHECMSLNSSRCGGFQNELVRKYGEEWGPYLHGLFGQVFASLPICTLIDESVLVIHGGVGRDPEQQLSLLQHLPDDCREPSVNPWGIEGDPHVEAMDDALWADPGDINGSCANTRGNSHMWGPDFTERFFTANPSLCLLVRSHQVPKGGRGVLIHEAHGGRVVTVFSASNYGGQGNYAGALLLEWAGGDVLHAVELNLGLCPTWEEICDLPLISGGSGIGRDLLKLSSRSVQVRRLQRSQTTFYNNELRLELLQRAMGLLMEFRAALWDACVARDPELQGHVDLSSWVRICESATRLREIPWDTLAELFGTVRQERVHYMETLGRVAFRITSAAVASDMAERVLSQAFTAMLMADDSLHRLIGKLSAGGSPSEGNPESNGSNALHDVLVHFRQVLAQSGVSKVGMDAVIRSLEAHIGRCSGHALNVAEFLSAWRRAADVGASGPASQAFLVDAISNLLRKTSAGGFGMESEDDEIPSVASNLMAFFKAADRTCSGYMSIEDGVQALMPLLVAADCNATAAGVQEVLENADLTGRGALNYLEFLRIFDHPDPHCSIHQTLLDDLCLQLWMHKNALSGFFRHIGSNGCVSRLQISWALDALNEAVSGRLDAQNIQSLVDAINFQDGLVRAKDVLRAFELFDPNED